MQSSGTISQSTFCSRRLLSSRSPSSMMPLLGDCRIRCKERSSFLPTSCTPAPKCLIQSEHFKNPYTKLSAYAISSDPLGMKPYFGAQIGHPFPSILYYQPSKILGFRSECEKEISCHLEAKPATCHARCDFQEIWYNALVHALDAFLGNNHSDCVEDAFVLISHT